MNRDLLTSLVKKLEQKEDKGVDVAVVEKSESSDAIL